MFSHLLESLRTGGQCQSCQKRGPTSPGPGQPTPSPPQKKRKTDKEAEALFKVSLIPEVNPNQPVGPPPPSTRSYRTAYKANNLGKKNLTDLFSYFFVQDVMDMYSNDCNDKTLDSDQKNKNSQCIKRYKTIVKSMILLTGKCPQQKPDITVDPDTQSETQDYKRWKRHVAAIGDKALHACALLIKVKDDDLRPITRSEIMDCGKCLSSQEMPATTPQPLLVWLGGVLSKSTTTELPCRAPCHKKPAKSKPKKQQKKKASKQTPTGCI